jgi:hypothetical protein
MYHVRARPRSDHGGEECVAAKQERNTKNEGIQGLAIGLADAGKKWKKREEGLSLVVDG